MKTVLVFLLNLLFVFSLQAQLLPSIEWQKSLGGTHDDYGTSVDVTNDGGYVIAGDSYSNNGNVSGNHGDSDFWVVKLNGNGEIEWQRCYGGSDWERTPSILNTINGGYIVAGTTMSNDGDISINHGASDVWVVKTDTIGNIEWEKTYGSYGGEGADCIQQTTDGGYIIAGYGGSCNNHQGLILKIKSNGDLEWETEVGGLVADRIYSIKQDSNNRFVFAGSSQSNSIGGYLGYDFYVGVLDSLGNLLWHDRYGGNNCDRAYSVELSHDGGYIVTGESFSNNGDVSGNHGSSDYWILNIDVDGNILWQKTIGGSSGECAYSIKPTLDYCYIIAGKSFSNDGDVTGNHGGADFWIIKIDQLGNLIWQNSYGGTDGDIPHSICQVSSSEYVVAGFSTSNDGDVSGHHGSSYYSDYWVVKLSLGTEVANLYDDDNEIISVFPNPTQGIINIVNGSKDNLIFELFNINGILLKTAKIKEKDLELDLSLYDRGIYFLNILSNRNIISTKKIIKR